MPTAYRYIRYSTARQALGDSLRRQLELSQQFAKQHNLTLDPEPILDKGVSGYSGANIDTGALGRFIESVKAGEIDSSAWLLVENLDRISRESVMDAFDTLKSIIKLGITIATVMDGKIYNTQSISSNNGIDLIIAITYLSRGHEESRTKAIRVQQQYNTKFNEAMTSKKPITKRCPSWLQYNDITNTFDIIEEKANVVRNIIEWIIAGEGGRAIAKRLNAANIPLLGDETKTLWTNSHVKVTAHKRAMIGEYVSKTNKHPTIENYYPAIVDTDRYNLAWEIVSTRIRDKTTRITTWALSAKIACTCGSNYRTVAYRQSCINSYHKGGCTAESIDHELLLRSVVEWITSIYTHQLVAVPDYSAIIKAEIDHLRLQKSRATKAILDVTDNDDIVYELNNINNKIKQLEIDLTQAKPIRPIGIVWARLRKLCSAYRDSYENNKEIVEIEETPMMVSQILQEMKTNFARVLDRIIIHPEIYYHAPGGYYFRKWELTGDCVSLFKDQSHNKGWMKLPIVGTKSNSRRKSQLNKGIAITTSDTNPIDSVFSKSPTGGVRIRISGMFGK